MKNLLTASLVLYVFILNAQTFTKSSPIAIDSDYGFYHPQIEMTGDGEPCVLWTSSDSSDLYFAKYNGVSDFNTPIKLNPDGLDVQDFVWSGADLAIDGNNIYAVFKQDGYSTGGIYLVKSTDNGLTFGDTVRVDDLATGYGQYPDVAVVNDTVWVTFMDHDAGGGNPQYVVSRSIDGGATFEPEVDAGTLWTGEACDCCQPEIIANDSKVIVILRNNNSNTRDIKAVVSNDRGTTFSDFFSLDDHNWVISSCPSTGPDASFYGQGQMISIYKSELLNDAAIYLHAYDITNDMSLGEVQVLASSSTNTIVNYPQLDFEETHNMLGFVWEGPGQGSDVFINATSTGISGVLSANALNVTDEVGTQNKPDIVIKDGVFHVVYADYNGQSVKYVRLTSNFANTEGFKSEFSTKVFPSPATDHVIIEFEKLEGATSTVQIFSVTGQLVYSNAGLETYKISRQDLKSGEYFFTIKQGNQLSQGKFQFID